MNPNRQVGQLLDAEHRASLELLNRLETALARRDDAQLQALAAPLTRALEQEIGRHFDFEEQQLFPLMAEAGDGDLATLLTEEHDTLRAVAAELLPLAKALALATGSHQDAQRPALQRLALEWSERLVAHIQKETMALLPQLDDLLDDARDRELSFAYAGS